jgi:hypothetical protein
MLVDWFILMDFPAALKLMRTFSGCHPRIFKQFAGFPEASCNESQSGYVVFVDTSLAKKTCMCELEDFAETNSLSIKPFGKALMITGPKGSSYNE